MWKLSTSNSVEANTLNLVSKAVDDFYDDERRGFKNIDRFHESIKNCEEHKETLGGYQKIIVIGLGGSSLGTKALCEAIYPGEWQEKVHFLDNVDVYSIDRFLSKIKNPEKISWVLCSKSGGTIEVQALYDYCHHYFKSENFFSIVENTFVVTEDKESPLYAFAEKNKRPRLTMPFDVGGRFSAFTPIGLYPLSFLGFDTEKAVRGFSKALKNRELVSELSGQLYDSYLRGEVNLYSFQYSDRLSHWSLWLQQLWSESLAKSIDRDGNTGPVISTFIPCRGASDQHSVLQQIIEGQEKKFVCFHRVLTSEKSQLKIQESVLGHAIMENKNLGELLKAEAIATEQAVHESGTQTLTLTTQDLDEESMAYLMGVWMLTIGVLGELFQVDAFNQPGVESGKVIARRVLSQSI